MEWKWVYVSIVNCSHGHWKNVANLILHLGSAGIYTFSIVVFKCTLKALGHATEMAAIAAVCVLFEANRWVQNKKRYIHFMRQETSSLLAFICKWAQFISFFAFKVAQSNIFMNLCYGH